MKDNLNEKERDSLIKYLKIKLKNWTALEELLIKKTTSSILMSIKSVKIIKPEFNFNESKKIIKVFQTIAAITSDIGELI